FLISTVFLRFGPVSCFFWDMEASRGDAGALLEHAALPKRMVSQWNQVVASESTGRRRRFAGFLFVLGAGFGERSVDSGLNPRLPRLFAPLSLSSSATEIRTNPLIRSSSRNLSANLGTSGSSIRANLGSSSRRAFQITSFGVCWCFIDDRVGCLH